MREIGHCIRHIIHTPGDVGGPRSSQHARVSSCGQFDDLRLVQRQFRSFDHSSVKSSSPASAGIRTHPLDIFPRTYSPLDIPLPDNSPAFLHGVGHFPFHHQNPPIYNIKRSIVNVHKIYGGTASYEKTVQFGVFT